MSAALRPCIKRALLKTLNEHADALANYEMHRSKEESERKSNPHQNKINQMRRKTRQSSAADSPVAPALENFMLVGLRVQLLKFLKSDDEHTRAQVSDGVHWIKCLMDSEAVATMEKESSFQIKDQTRAIFQISSCRFVHVKLKGHSFYYLMVEKLAPWGAENTGLIGTPMHINDDQDFLAQSRAIFEGSGAVINADIVSSAPQVTSNSNKDKKKQKKEVIETIDLQNHDSGRHLGWGSAQLLRRQTTETANESKESIIENLVQFHDALLNDDYDIQKSQGGENAATNTASASKLLLVLQTPSISQQNHQTTSIDPISEAKRAETRTKSNYNENKAAYEGVSDAYKNNENEGTPEIITGTTKLSKNTALNQDDTAVFLTQADVNIEMANKNTVESQPKTTNYSAVDTVDFVEVLHNSEQPYEEIPDESEEEDDTPKKNLTVDNCVKDLIVENSNNSENVAKSIKNCEKKADKIYDLLQPICGANINISTSKPEQESKQPDNVVGVPKMFSDLSAFQTQSDDNSSKSVELTAFANEKTSQGSNMLIDNDLVTINSNDAKEVHQKVLVDSAKEDILTKSLEFEHNSESQSIKNSLKILEGSFLHKVDSDMEDVTDLISNSVNTTSMNFVMGNLYDAEDIIEETQKVVSAEIAENAESFLESFKSNTATSVIWNENFSEVGKEKGFVLVTDPEIQTFGTFETSPNEKVLDAELDARTVVNVSNTLQIQRYEIVESHDAESMEPQEYVKHVEMVDSIIGYEVKLEDLKTRSHGLQPSFSDESKSILESREDFVGDSQISLETKDSPGQIFRAEIPKSDELFDTLLIKSKMDSSKSIEDKLGAIMEDAQRTIQVISEDASFFVSLNESDIQQLRQAPLRKTTSRQQKQSEITKPRTQNEHLSSNGRFNSDINESINSMQVDTPPTQEPTKQSQTTESIQSPTRRGSLSPNLDSDTELASSGWSRIPVSGQVRRDLTDSAAFSTQSTTFDSELDFGSLFSMSSENFIGRSDDAPLSLIEESTAIDGNSSEQASKRRNRSEKDNDVFDFEVAGIRIVNSAYKLPQTVSLREITLKR
ncbi:hypothetical protein HK100_009130 [Physocladia obscura]|uniref:Shelterin complex subunit TPP1/Est3 domain-containing protein n=1 Tax=Physocladia obscura TaxID=109957 RepID=A0AAD5T9I4_9FUNG|nr:hypothetical protein HK100_009130 [Physocladia obscura]